MTGTYRLWMRWADDEANTGPTRLAAQQALREKEIWVGWARVRDASAFGQRETAKTAIARAYRHVRKRKREVAQEAGSAIRFFGMKPGDHVVVPTSRDEFAIVEVAPGEPLRRAYADDYVWARPARILNSEVPRADASKRLRRLMSVPHTCLDISKAARDVARFL